MGVSQIILSSDGRNSLLPSEKDRRLAVRTLSRVAGGEIVVFSIVDDHIHIVALADRHRAGRLSQILGCALRAVSAVPMAPARIRPVGNRTHLTRLVPYLLNQVGHHGISCHPALWSGSCFQDIVGARIVRGLRLQIGEALPRVTMTEICRAVGIEAREIGPVPDADVRAAGGDALGAAVASALAVGPELEGKSRRVVFARRIAVQMGRSVGIPGVEIARGLGIDSRTVRRLAGGQANPAVERAVRIRLSIERAVRGMQRPDDAREASRMCTGSMGR